MFIGISQIETMYLIYNSSIGGSGGAHSHSMVCGITMPSVIVDSNIYPRLVVLVAELKCLDSHLASISLGETNPQAKLQEVLVFLTTESLS